MQLLDFLLEAKLHGYAGVGDRDEAQLEDGAKRLRYRAGEFLYQDIYYGSNPFIGEELVFKNGVAAWAMNYYGLVLDASVPADQVYRFLQQAMRMVGPERPFRGPEVFVMDDWEYRDASQGNLEAFTGQENIFFQHRLVYQLNYHGGRLAD